MVIKKIIKELNPLAVLGDLPKTISGLEYNSKNIKEGSIFIAVKGYATDGNRYVDNAISNGAVAVISENSRPSGLDILWIKVEDARVAMAKAAMTFWNVDFSSIFSVAITGTNGKTTVATIFNHLLRTVYGEDNAWQIGTIGNWYGNIFSQATRTTPEAIDLLREIGESRTKPKSLVMEVSSHALMLERVKGFKYDIAIFTNLTQDHLDFHEDMDSYYDAKKLLFVNHLKNSGTAIVNIDDIYGRKLATSIKGNIITFGKDKSADFNIQSIHCSWSSTTVNAVFNGNRISVLAPLVGAFNGMNMAAVIVSALSKNIDINIIKRVFKSLKPVPGRMEKIGIDAPFSVIVDYAHTPDALINVLKTAKKITNGRVLVLFGAGGDRDATKRVPMSMAVAQNSDYAVITSDNPRSENPIDILNSLNDAMAIDFPREVIENRHNAIISILRFARAGDSVIIAGKGHETYQEIMGVKHHFDDRQEVVNCWREINGEDA